MKLISLNVEGVAHIQRIEPFLTHEKADVVCLQEGTRDYVQILENLGYTTSFLPRCTRMHDGVSFVDGLIVSSVHPITFSSHHYYKPFDEIRDEVDEQTHMKQRTPKSVLLATIMYDTVEYNIGTTHFTWTPNGDTANEAQQEDMTSFLNVVAKLPSHIMCGDFNIPRHYSELYSLLLPVYKDEIPEIFKSTLDPNLHKMRNDPIQKEKLDRYVVDYIFTQPPYTVENVRLQFGISDHAGVIADIYKRPT